MPDQINVNEKISFRLPPAPALAYALFPLEVFGIGLFLLYAVTHWSLFLDQTKAFFVWLVWFAGLVAYTALVWFIIRVARAGIDAFLALAHGLADLHAKIVSNRVAGTRIELLETRDHYVVYRQAGKILVQPVAMPRQTIAAPAEAPELLPPGPGPEAGVLPSKILYEDIRHQVPRGHVLVGVGTRGIETKEEAVGALVLIVGLSGTGKTSTTVLRVEERYASGHQFMVVDPHFFKTDSLTNAIQAYSGAFLMPIAKTPEATLEVLRAFLAEFNARKTGQRAHPWQKITLLVDEVTSFMDLQAAEDADIALEIKKLLKSIARICGQEARDFQMAGIFISQQMTEIAWLRKMALMVIVHQLLMTSEKKLACNEDAAVMKDMERWPRGRTYVYGVGFDEGPRTVQQPYFAAPKASYRPEETVVDATIVEEAAEACEEAPDDLPLDVAIQEALDAWNKGATGPRGMQRALGCTYYRACQLCKELEARGLVELD